MPFISLQFSAQNDLGSEAIRLFDHGKYSHVDYVMPDGRLLGARDDALDGTPSGVQIRPANYANFSEVKRVDLQVTSETLSGFVIFLDKQLGKKYDETAILSFIVDRDWREEDSWFCSEMIAAGLEQCLFFQWPLAATINKITPDNLFMILSGRVNVNG